MNDFYENQSALKTSNYTIIISMNNKCNNFLDNSYIINNMESN